jgi:hypothetical protein
VNLLVVVLVGLLFALLCLAPTVRVLSALNF